MKIWQASVAADTNDKPGEIIAAGSDGIVVACGRGTLVLEVVQRSGGKKLNAAEFLSGHPLQPGDCFECRDD